MIAASFLIKHRRIDWRYGEGWIWDTLVDAEIHHPEILPRPSDYPDKIIEH